MARRPRPEELPDAPPVVAGRLKKVVPLAHSGARLRLAVAQELFSSHDIDVGTALLLRVLAEQPGIRGLRRVLDVGCGYGPIGLLLAAWNPDAEVHCVDRDALAVAFTAYNAVLNGLPRVRAYPSLGYDDVDGTDFDLVVSNVPAKAGPGVIAALVRDARHRLTPAGVAAVVGIDRIAPQIADVLQPPDFEVLARRAGRGYTCSVYRATAPATPPGLDGFARGDATRARVTVSLGGRELGLTTSWGLPEFDTVGFPTQLAAALLTERDVDLSHPVVVSPAQGHLPVLLAACGAPRLTLVDRDLLALRTSRANLLAAGLPPESVQIELVADPAPVDGASCAVAVLRDPQAQLTNARAVEAMRNSIRRRDGRSRPIVVAGGSTAVTRAIEAAGLTASARTRRAGASAVLVTGGPAAPADPGG